MREPAAHATMGAMPDTHHPFERSDTTRFLLFTGKGGVGKTTVACATAVALAEKGSRVLVVSTDPASNLDDVLGTRLGPAPTAIQGIAGLWGMNIDPEAAARDYRERTLAPFREVVPAAELTSMEEQLSGQCTVEIAAFDEFSLLLGAQTAYDHVVFDTAPTGHTLRLLSLPAAWSEYLVGSPAGASCLGPLASLEDKRQLYEDTVAALRDPHQATLTLVSRPERSALREAARAATELAALGVTNQRLVINGVLDQPGAHKSHREPTPYLGGLAVAAAFTLTVLVGAALRPADDDVALAYTRRQADALRSIPDGLHHLPTDEVPLTAFEITGIEALRHLVRGTTPDAPEDRSPAPDLEPLTSLVEDLLATGPGVTMVMGKGGVGKTTVAASLAVALAGAGADVHLATTDPAGHFSDVTNEGSLPEMEISTIDPEAERQRYVQAKLRSAHDLEPDQIALLEEDLRSPCTEEIAVFQAFASILRDGRRRHVILDTAPSGHTLMLLDQTGSYHRDVMRNSAGVGGRVTTPLMRIQDPAFTRVLIVALAESTPVQEAADLQADLARAEIRPYGWVVNASLSATGTRHPVLAARAASEHRHLERIRTELSDRTWLIPWLAEPSVERALGG